MWHQETSAANKFKLRSVIVLLLMIPPGKPSVYEAYPNGNNDNTHFQPDGAIEVARLVFEALSTLSNR